jgi:hypothetical protein
MEEILIINLNNIVELAGQIYLLSDSEELVLVAFVGGMIIGLGIGWVNRDFLVPPPNKKNKSIKDVLENTTYQDKLPRLPQ